MRSAPTAATRGKRGSAAAAWRRQPRGSGLRRRARAARRTAPQRPQRGANGKTPRRGRLSATLKRRPPRGSTRHGATARRPPAQQHWGHRTSEEEHTAERPRRADSHAHGQPRHGGVHRRPRWALARAGPNWLEKAAGGTDGQVPGTAPRAPRSTQAPPIWHPHAALSPPRLLTGYPHMHDKTADRSKLTNGKRLHTGTTWSAPTTTLHTD